MALLEKVPISGSSAIRRATVRSATPLIERKVASSACPQRIGADQRNDLRLDLAALIDDGGEHSGEGGEDLGLVDQLALVGLADAQVGQLAQARAHKGREFLLCLVAGAGRRCA